MHVPLLPLAAWEAFGMWHVACGLAPNDTSSLHMGRVNYVALTVKLNLSLLTKIPSQSVSSCKYI